MISIYIKRVYAVEASKKGLLKRLNILHSLSASDSKNLKKLSKVQTHKNQTKRYF